MFQKNLILKIQKFFNFKQLFCLIMIDKEYHESFYLILLLLHFNIFFII